MDAKISHVTECTEQKQEHSSDPPAQPKIGTLTTFHGTAWHGRHPITRLDVALPPVQGDFVGVGFYEQDDFVVVGRRVGATVMLRTVPPDNTAKALQGGIFHWQAVYDEDSGTLSGKCSRSRDCDDRSWAPLEEFCCNVELKVWRPEDPHALYRLHAAAAESDRSKALWKFLQYVVLHQAHCTSRYPGHAFLGGCLAVTRATRQRYIELYSRAMDNEWLGQLNYTRLARLSDEEEGELRSLELFISIRDVLLYRSMAYLYMRQEVIHE